MTKPTTKPTVAHEDQADHQEALADARKGLREAVEAAKEGDASEAYEVLMYDVIPALAAAMSYEEDDEDEEEDKPAKEPAAKPVRAERKAKNRAEAAAKRGGK